MNNTVVHQKFVQALLLAFGSKPYMRVWERFVGAGRAMNSDRIIAFGLPGESDIQGILMPNGRMICIEAKTGKAKLTDRQEKFRAMILKFGGIYIEARADSEAGIAKGVERAIAELETSI